MIFGFKYRGNSYEFDDEVMSLPEARFIKARTGLAGMRFFQAARELDPDCLHAMLVVGMRRAGEKVDEPDDVLADDPNGYFDLVKTVEVSKSPSENSEE